jgi:hypothetical protein
MGLRQLFRERKQVCEGSVNTGLLLLLLVVVVVVVAWGY